MSANVVTQLVTLPCPEQVLPTCVEPPFFRVVAPVIVRADPATAQMPAADGGLSPSSRRDRHTLAAEEQKRRPVACRGWTISPLPSVGRSAQPCDTRRWSEHDGSQEPPPAVPAHVTASIAACRADLRCSRHHQLTMQRPWVPRPATLPARAVASSGNAGISLLGCMPAPAPAQG